MPSLPDGSRNETVVRLRAFRSDPKMAELNPELSELADSIGP